MQYFFQSFSFSFPIFISIEQPLVEKDNLLLSFSFFLLYYL